MQPFLRVLASCAVLGIAAAQPPTQPLHYRQPVLEKNFPLLAVLSADPEAAAALERDPTLRQLARRKGEQRRHALEHCEQDLRCLLDAFRLSEDEIAGAAGALARLADEPGLRRLVTYQIRPQAVLFRHHSRPDAQLLELGWREAAAGINRLIEVYGDGKPPRYAAIDSPMFDTGSEIYRRLIYNVVVDLNERVPAAELFFETSLGFALALLEINLRDEAGRFEPLDLGENRAALAQVARTDFDRFPYSAILVPGAGPDRPGVALSPAGKLRVRIAARRYHAGKAPFLVVSGGFVHPNQTPFCEAIEMKKALMRDFGVPESAIFVDPHARHTTTNLRNAARILLRYGLPGDRPALVTTDVYQSRYIESPQFAERCKRELGYVPFESLRRVSLFDLEWRPRPESLHADPQDPLDP
jgi:hypothetical protein